MLGSRGVGILGVLIASVLVAAGGFFLIQGLTGFNKAESHLDTSTKAQQLMASVASELQRLPLTEIERLCLQYGAFGASPLTPCLAGDSLITAGQPGPPTIPTLATRLEWNGTVAASGPACLHIIRCGWLGGRRVLDVQMRGHWVDPMRPQNLKSDVIAIRRTAW